MLVALAAVASVVLFLAILGLVGFAHIAEARERRRRRHLEFTGILAGVTFENLFDDNYALIRDTQVPVLQEMLAAGSHGVSLSTLRKTFRSISRRYPDLFDGYCFEQWLAFLEQAGLVFCRDKRIVLSHEGRGFLDHRRVTH